MPEPLIRILNHGGERWLNLSELKALADTREDLLMQACSVLVVAHQQGHSAADGIKAAIGSFLMAAAGDDNGEVIQATEKPAQRLLDAVRLAQSYYDGMVAIRDEPEIRDAATFARGFINGRPRPSLDMPPESQVSAERQK